MAFRLQSKEDVRLAIRRRGNEIAAQLSDKAIFLDSEFKKYITKLLDFILRNHRLYSLTLIYDDTPGSLTACTDGKSIQVNAGNDLVRHSRLLERRFKVVMGLAFHEAAHKLFMDFTTHKKAMDTISNGKLYGKFDTGGIPELGASLEELKKVTASPYAQAIATVYSELSNIVGDGHDERLMCQTFPGFIKECIQTMDEVQYDLSPTVNDMIDHRSKPYGIITKLMLDYCIFGTYKAGDSSPEVEDYLTYMTNLEPVMDMALETDRLKDRYEHLNTLVLLMWPKIRDMFPDLPQQPQSSNGHGQDQGQSSSSGGGSGGQSSAQDVTQQIQQQAQAVRQAAGSSPDPVNCSGKGIDSQEIKNSGYSVGAGNDLQNISQTIAYDQAASLIQRELDLAQQEAIKAMGLPKIHHGILVHTNRHFTPLKAKYDRILSEVAPLARNLVKLTKEILSAYNEEHIQRHLRFGPIVDATAAYRPDHAFFAKKKIPEDLPNMAVCYLQDVSGSMGGEKLEAATKTMIMVEKFASELGIPCMITTHSASYNSVNFNIYTDFVSTMEANDRYALAGVTASGTNRDGLPLRLCCELLAQRPERVKLLIVTSDGRPSNYNTTAEGVADVIATVKEFRRKGILIYGAALDEDRELIESIYGKFFLSITNLSTFPKTLIRVMRQHMVN